MLSILLTGLISTAAAADVPAAVSVRRDGAGVIYADAQDRTLYTYEQDKGGKSACIGACAKLWPPLLAPTDARTAAAWSTIARGDGQLQWAWHGKPVYTYAKDNPGTLFGDGAGNAAWHAAFEAIETPPGVRVRQSLEGRLLANHRNMALYWRKSGDCSKECLERWIPVRAPLAAVPMGDWVPAAREDGTRQWSYGGKALYSFAGDIAAGEVNGAGDGWEPAILAPAAPNPSWVTFRSSDFGQVYADSRGHTLYIGPAQLDRIKELICDQACIDKVWTTVKAESAAKPIGDWSIVADEKGDKVWAFRGNIVYLHLRDTRPGDIGGDKFAAGIGVGGSWSPIIRKGDGEE